MTNAIPVGVHLTPGSVRAISNGHKASVFREPPTPQQVIGNAVHATLAWTYRQPLNQRSAEQAQHALTFYWELEARCCPWVSDKQMLSWRVEARRLLALYLTEDRLRASPLAIECHLRCVLPSGATLSGRADRIDETVGGLDVIDYKTGRCSITEEQLSRVPSAQLYAVCAEQMFNTPVAAVSFHYLRTNTVCRWEIQPGEVQSLVDTLDNLAVSQTPTPLSDRPGA